MYCVSTACVCGHSVNNLPETCFNDDDDYDVNIIFQLLGNFFRKVSILHKLPETIGE